MSTSNGKLGDDFLWIQKLVADGENWMMYKERLQWSIDTRGLLGHLDGTETKPIDPQTLSGRGASWVPTTTDELKEVSTYKTKLKEWCMGQAITKQQIAGTIPDSLFIQIKNLDTAKEIFTHLSNLFEQCSHVVSVKLL
ncbi:hypothetical protein F4604DRAFT_1574347 [Suillus subluteus]|nr:hypothetical protein F4604DRAFT_1574347 [Suillus subluteus]